MFYVLVPFLGTASISAACNDDACLGTAFFTAWLGDIGLGTVLGILV
jgi:hypothetical protein